MAGRSGSPSKIRGDRKCGMAGRSGSPSKIRGDGKCGMAGRSGSPSKIQRANLFTAQPNTAGSFADAGTTVLRPVRVAVASTRVRVSSR